jgi:predicted ATP-grasp superfamily ATP-dependent carboligase
VFGGQGEGEDYLETIRRIVRAERIDLILPVYEDAVRFVSVHRADLEQFCRCALTPPADLMDRLADKWQTACLLGTSDIPLPETVLLTERNIRETSLLPPFPVLLKPLVGQGGREVTLVASREEFARLLQLGVLTPGRQIVQRFVRGHDIDCSVLCRDGDILAHTIQSAVLRHPVRFAPAVGVNFIHDEQVLRIARDVMGRLRWNGIAHLDMRKDEDSGAVLLLEINPRFWMSVIGSVHAGVNFPYLACRAAMGERFDPPAWREGPFVWRFQSAVRLLLTGRSLVGTGGMTPGRTVLRYSLADPGPDLFPLAALPMRGWQRRPVTKQGGGQER